MKRSYSITHRFKFLAALALSLGAAASITRSASAETFRYWSNPLFVKGYQTYTNMGFVDPANPIILQVRTGGEGGVAHFGKMRSGSIDQTVNLATGELLESSIILRHGSKQDVAKFLENRPPSDSVNRSGKL